MATLAPPKPSIANFFCINKKFLVYNLVSRNLKTRYHRSVLGFVWTLVTPMAMAVVYYFIFKYIFKVQGEFYGIYLISGIIPYTFFSQSIMDGMESIVGTVGLISRVPVPLQVMPFSTMLTALVNLLLSYPVIIGAALLVGVPLSATMLLIPFLFVALMLMTYAMSMFLAVGLVYFRDLRQIMNIVMQIWFYGTPIVYQVEMVPENFRWALFVNPISPYFVALRDLLIAGSFPSADIAMACFGWFAVLMAGAMLVYRNSLKGIVEIV